MPGFLDAMGRVIGRGCFFADSGYTGPDLGEERGGARKGMPDASPGASGTFAGRRPYQISKIHLTL
jgi:hypothetical protein